MVGCGAPGRLPDLEVRLHSPLPQVVIVRVTGTMAGPGVGMVAQRVAQQLGRAAHVVLDLGEVRVLDTDGVNALLDLHRNATTRGVRLHLTGTDHKAVSAPLRLTGIDDELPAPGSYTDAVVALLVARLQHPSRLTRRTVGTARAQEACLPRPAPSAASARTPSSRTAAGTAVLGPISA